MMQLQHKEAHAVGHEVEFAIGKMWHREVESSSNCVDEVKVFFPWGSTTASREGLQTRWTISEHGLTIVAKKM
jgi:hypothetical protein